jgi:hypothetical protein
MEERNYARIDGMKVGMSNDLERKKGRKEGKIE